MGIQITPSTKIGRGYLGLSLEIPAGKITVKSEEFLIDFDEKTGKIGVRSKDGESCGEGSLRKNEKKKTDRSPDFVGYIRVFADEYEVIAYNQSSLSISVFEDGEPEGGGK
jgi:hypothetical protein